MTLAWQENRKRESLSEVIQLPLPYELPPQPYGPQGQTILIPSWLRHTLFITYSDLFQSYQMFPGLGIVGIPKKMSKVRFGHVKFNFMLPRTLGILFPTVLFHLIISLEVRCTN